MPGYQADIEDVMESSEDEEQDDEDREEGKLERGDDSDVESAQEVGHASTDRVEEPVKPKVHKLSLAKTGDFNDKLRKRGVVYIARVPPRMTPTKIKKLLSDFGVVTRVYLVEEDAAVRKRRRKLSGNGSKRYNEGWVEFESKKVAKHVASALNNTVISNHKRNPHYGDLWNLKYLHKFKWSHLTEKVAYERRVREQKLRLETMQARRETASYKQLVETGKKLDKIEERRKRKAEKEGREAEVVNNKPRTHKQVKEVHEATSKSTKKALLGALV